VAISLSCRWYRGLLTVGKEVFFEQVRELWQTQHEIRDYGRGGDRSGLTRIAHEILEHNKGCQDVVLIGIRTRGCIWRDG